MKGIIIFLYVIALALSSHIMAQHGIGTNDANPNAMLDVASSDKGVLFPRINLTSRSTLLPITGAASDAHNGMIVYNTNPTLEAGLMGEGFYFWSGGATGQWNMVVNTSAPTAGELLTWNGMDWSTDALETAYSFFPIWAEEGNFLNNNRFEWSFGSGDETLASQGIPIPESGVLFAIGVSLVGANATTINVIINGVSVATTNPYTGTGTDITNLLTPVSITAGDLINFQTNVAGGASEGKVVAWLRKSTKVELSLSSFLDVNHAGVITSTNDVLRWDGNDWSVYTPNANPNALNDIPDVDTATNPPITGDFLNWNGTQWVSDSNAIVDLSASASISNASIINFNSSTSFSNQPLAALNFNEFMFDVTPDGIGFTIQTAGTYHISYSGVFTSTGTRATTITRINAGGNIGGDDFAYLRNNTVNQGATSGSYTTPLNIGDTVRLQSKRIGNINTVNTDAIGAVTMSITRIN